MEIIKALNNIVVNLRKENIEHSVEKIMNLYDSNYPYTFNLIICKMVQTHISLNWENCNSYLCFLQTLQKSEEKEHPNQPKIFSIFENILEKSYKHEAFYLLDKMIECNLINSKITKDIKIKYFAHYKTEEENKKRYFNFDLFEEAFLNNYTELSRNDFELHKKYVKEGVNPNEIEKIIRNDEIEKLQEITSQNDFDFDQTIKPSLYERCDYINNYTKDEGVTLIDYAAFFGSVKCFKYLLMNGANIKKTGKYAVASGNLEIIHLCKQNNSSFKGSYKAAIKFHQNDIFHFLYENKFEDFNNQKSPIKFINILGATCISYDNYEILSFLEEEGMEPDQYIINRASTIGNLYLVKYFIKNNPTPKDILVFSVISKNIELVKYLLEQNLIDINAKNNLGQTALIDASQYGYTEIFILLLEQEGIDVNAKDNLGYTALIDASQYGYTEIVKLLLEQEGIDVNAKDFHEGTALIYASSKGYTEIVKLLLDKEGIVINAKDFHGATALMLASYKGYTEIVKLLLEQKGIDIKAKDEGGKTALIKASENGHIEIVKLLLEQKGININAQDKSGKTALMKASEKGYTEIVKLLLEQKGININAKDKFGNTALIWASSKGYTEIVKLLLEKEGIVINAKDFGGNTALIYASAHGHLEIVKLLLKQEGININAKNKNGQTSHIVASLNGHTEIVNLLLEQKGNDINTQTCKENSFLFLM